ncbi:MAG: hypothetical protein R6U44_06570 [Archaeoglobaceae archaeon]
MVPKSGELLDCRSEDNIEEIKGIGEREIPIVIKEFKIKLGELMINARVAWKPY